MTGKSTSMRLMTALPYPAAMRPAHPHKQSSQNTSTDARRCPPKTLKFTPDDLAAGAAQKQLEIR